MRNKLLFLGGFIFLVFLLPFKGYSQPIIVNSTAPYNSPFWLVENVLIDTNFTVLPPYDPPLSFIPFTQPPSQQLGFFDASGTPFPLDSGIVMCTDFADAVVPGNFAGSPTAVTPDSNLSAILTQLGLPSNSINDKVSIEFTFISVSDSINFNYIFASDEYSSYACSDFNDVFGFFLTGYGINGNPGLSTVNLATIPGTNIPISINTINSGSPGASGTASKCLTANPNYVAHSVYYNASNFSTIAMDGYTDVFRAKAEVECGGFYHIKLVIADVTDHSLPSAVFLEANSFKSPQIEITSLPNYGNTFTDSAMVEDCNRTPIILTKTGAYIGKGLSLVIDATGSAIEGTDYIALPDSIYIPPAQLTDTIYIEPIQDGLSEGVENIVVDITQLQEGCFIPFDVSAEFFIRDQNSLVLDARIGMADSIVLACPNDSAELTATYSGGDGNLTGWWQDDPTANDTRFVNPSQTTPYYFSLIDECTSDTLTDTVYVIRLPYDTVQTVTQYIEACEDEEITIKPSYTGGTPPFSISWDHNVSGDSIEVQPPNDSTWFVYYMVDSCGLYLKDSIFVYFKTNPTIDFEHFLDESKMLNVSFTTDSTGIQSYSWDFGDGNTSALQNPSHDYSKPGNYEVTLTVMTAEGCYVSVTKSILVEDTYRLFIPNAFTPNGDGINEVFQIVGQGIAKYNLQIFSRWGEMIFESNSIEDSWDGTIDGKKAPAGVYTLMLNLESTAGTEYEEWEHITIIY